MIPRLIFQTLRQESLTTFHLKHIQTMTMPMAKVVSLNQNGQKGCETTQNCTENGVDSDWNHHLEAACTSLKNNNLVAVPTDTIYGIAGLAQSTEAVNKIYGVKSRDHSKPIAICVGDVKDVYRWGQVTISPSLLEELLPGPVTVVFERTKDLNPHLNPGTSLVGIRVPNHGFVRELARASGQPLALTSANPSATPSTVSVKEFECLWPHLDIVFDGGILGETRESRLGSTVVDLSKPGKFTIIRPGSAHRETVEKLQKYEVEECTER